MRSCVGVQGGVSFDVLPSMQYHIVYVSSTCMLMVYACILRVPMQSFMFSAVQAAKMYPARLRQEAGVARTATGALLPLT